MVFIICLCLIFLSGYLLATDDKIKASNTMYICSFLCFILTIISMYKYNFYVSIYFAVLTYINLLLGNKYKNNF